MQSLSHKEYGVIKSVYESVYDSSRFETVIDGFTDEDLKHNFTEDYIEENVEELFIECMEEGMAIDEVEDILTESIESSIRLLSEDRYGSAVSASKANAQKPEVKAANRREALRKVGSAVKKVASGLKKGATAAAKGAKVGVKAAGKAAQGGVGLAGRAVGTAQRAGERIKSAAKSGYERGRKGSGSSSGGSAKVTQGSGDSYSSSSSSSSPASSSSSSSSDSDSGSSSSAPAPKKRKDGLLKRGLKKLVRGIGKGVSAAAGAVKAGADSLTDRARKEELEATGLFSEKEIEAIMESDLDQMQKDADANRARAAKLKDRNVTRGSASFAAAKVADDVKKAARTGPQQHRGTRTGGYRVEGKEEAEIDEAMSSYDRNRKRAAERAAARNAARDAGKTGVVPGVGYVTPRRERETYVDSAGVTRHKSGAKMEEVEAVGEGLTGERYKAALKKGKMYSRMVSADPEKRATRGGRGGESDFGAGDRGTGNRSRRRRGLSVGDED
jgi:hypothetical protein